MPLIYRPRDPNISFPRPERLLEAYENTHTLIAAENAGLEITL